MNTTLQNATHQALQPEESSARAVFMSGANKPAQRLDISTEFVASPKLPDFQHDYAFDYDGETGEITDIEVDSDGFSKSSFDSDSYRSQKYLFQEASSKILRSSFVKDGKKKSFRVKNCLRDIVSPFDEVSVYKSCEHGQCHYGGLMVCGSVWTCPVCASKISQRKANLIEKISSAHLESGGSILFLTFTAPHSIKDSLESLLTRFKKAERGFSCTRAVIAEKQRIGFIEPIKNLEITFGHENGWHPHSHQMWFIEGSADPAEVKRNLFTQWQNYCKKRGLEEPNETYGLDVKLVKDTKKVSKYICKMGWSISSELARGIAKKAKQGRYNHFDLLGEYTINGKQWASERFKEFAKATFGLHQLSRFPKLKERYKHYLDDEEIKQLEMNDEELAEDKNDSVIHLGAFNRTQWKTILKNRLRFTVLLLCEKYSFEFAASYIDNFKCFNSHPH